MSLKINTSVPSEELATQPNVLNLQPKQPTVVEGNLTGVTSTSPAASEDANDVKTEEKPLSPHFAQLARRERMLRRQLEDMKRREEAFKSKEQEYSSKYVPRDQIAEEFRSNPMESMRKYGLSYDQLTQAALNAPSPQDQMISELKKEIAALRGGVDETKNLISKQQSDAYDQALNQIRMETKQLIFQDPQFETVKEMAAEESVVELIKETFDKTGTIMSVEEAAKEVEEYLLDETLRLMKNKKIQERMNPAPAASAPEVKAPITSAKTLTHANSASQTKGLTAYERAMLAFKGELK